MPYAPKICKDILKALDENIIPALRSQEVLSLLAAPPFDFSAVKHWTIRKKLLPDNDKGPLQILRKWPKQNMAATRGLYLSFLYEGTMHQKVGALASHGKLMKRKKLIPPPGIQIVEATAPSCTVYSDFTARQDGYPYPESKGDYSRKVKIMLLQNTIHISHSIKNAEQTTPSHHLLIVDQSISQLGTMYLNQLKLNKNSAFAQTLLLAIMYQFQYNLQCKRPRIGNSAWINIKEALSKPRSEIELKHQDLCTNVIDYVQNHIHLKLSLKMIADHFGVSAFHLNTVFQQIHGTTLMRYVTDFRIAAAKRILIADSERIKDVARLTGFASANSFSHVFRKKTGMSPRKFRHERTSNGR